MNSGRKASRRAQILRRIGLVLSLLGMPVALAAAAPGQPPQGRLSVDSDALLFGEPATDRSAKKPADIRTSGTKASGGKSATVAKPKEKDRQARKLAMVDDSTSRKKDRSVTVPIQPARATMPMPVAAAPSRSFARPLVVIDAGHGGHDPGSLSTDGGRREKDVALAIARAIRDELNDSGRVRVAMTRDDDRFLVLGERREIARRLKADLFISVHADSAANKDARGATVYTLSEVASDRVAAQLAAKENKADIINGVDLGGDNSDVSSILIDLAQRETMNVSSSFAALLQREMSSKVSFRTSFHRFAGLVVLKAPDVPSVLLETGYMSNDDDLKLLHSSDYRRNVAVGVRRAVEAHFARRLAQR